MKKLGYIGIEKMKIIQWLDKFYPPMGGGPTFVITLTGSMPDIEFVIMANASYGYPIVKQYSKNTLIQSFLPNDIIHNSRYKGIAKPILLPYKVISEYIRFKKKQKFLEMECYDILHINGPEINYGFTTFDRQLHGSFFQKIANFNFINKPKVLTLHGMPSLQTNNYCDFYNEKRMIEIFDNIICVEKFIYEHVKEYTESRNLQKNVWFIPNFVDTDKFKFTEPTYKEKIKVLFIGRLDPVRGLDLIYRLIKNLPGYVELDIIGSGNNNQLNELKSFINGKRDIKFYENIQNEFIPKYIADCDIVLNPGKLEGISRASLESLSCGRPVIMLDVGDRYPTIHHKTGYLIKDDINELLYLFEYINNNRRELENLGKNARKIIEDEFSNDIITPKIKNIYKDLIK